MHRALIFVPAVLAVSLGGCVVGMASGQEYSETLRKTYTNFDKVDVSAGIEVVISQGAFDVQAQANKGENFDQLIVEVKGDTLHVSRKQNMMSWGGPKYRVSVSAPAYSEIEVSSGATLAGANLTLRDLEIEVSSGANVELSGACAALDLEISSGAHFDGAALKCDAANVQASSGASVQAFAAKSATGDASSGASVQFLGNPASFTQDTSSGGSVSAR